MWTGTFASIMAARPRCPNAMSPDSDCACGGPPTTGSTTSWASRSSRSNGRSTTACWRRLRSDIVPRLLKDVPGQPTEEELEADRYRARFVILFDREGYSPEFFKEMWQTHRIACITYHKYPKDDWPATEFAEIETTLPSGEQVSLATRRAGQLDRRPQERALGAGDPQADRQWASGQPDQHGFRRIGAARTRSACSADGPRKTSSRYMMEHFAIDLLNEYRTEEIPETKRPVVNPEWRELDRQKRSVKSKLTHRQARFAALTLHPESDEAAQAKWEKQKAELVEAIEQFEKRTDGHQRPVEDDAQPPGVGRVARRRRSSSDWPPAASNWSTR